MKLLKSLFYSKKELFDSNLDEINIHISTKKLTQTINQLISRNLELSDKITEKLQNIFDKIENSKLIPDFKKKLIDNQINKNEKIIKLCQEIENFYKIKGLYDGFYSSVYQPNIKDRNFKKLKNKEFKKEIFEYFKIFKEIYMEFDELLEFIENFLNKDLKKLLDINNPKYQNEIDQIIKSSNQENGIIKPKIQENNQLSKKTQGNSNNFLLCSTEQTKKKKVRFLEDVKKFYY